MLRIVAALVLAVPAAAQWLPTTSEFRRHLLEVIASYPTDGTHGYHWPKSGSWAGVTRDLEYRGEVAAKGDPEGRCYCCGLTLEVFLRAFEAAATAARKPYRIPGFRDAESLAALRRAWFGSDGNRRTLQNAIQHWELGRAIELDDARRGDFAQIWRHSGSGHSVVFLDWVREDGEIVGMRYWSTQKSTDGIGERVERFGGERGVDPEQIWLARVGVEDHAIRVVSYSVARTRRGDVDPALSVVLSLDADVVCMQAADPNETFAEPLAGFTRIGARSVTPIFVRTSRFEVLGHGVLLLDRPPVEPGTPVCGTRPAPRCTWAKLRDRTRDRRRDFVAVSLWMSSPNAELRELEVRGLLRDLEELSDLPCVLAGDFDAGRREAPLRELLRAGFRESVRKARPELVAFDDEIRATGGKLLGPKKLDFVLVDDGSALLDAALEPVPSEGSRRTHFPVWADVVLRR